MTAPALVALEQLVTTALAEDLGPIPVPERDVTATATVPAHLRATAAVVPRAAGVVAGLDAVVVTYRLLDPAVTVDLAARDGDAVAPGQPVAVVAGPATSVLAGGRTALNLLTHASGIATLTRRFVDAVAGTGCLVRDSRKTLPGLRALQKAAVVAGGGHNHRMALVTGLLVKDNHVAAAGGVTAATRAALAAAGDLEVQVEVDTLEELDEALAAGARRILLDNFTLDDLAAGVARCRAVDPDTFVEASGGVTLDTAAAIAATGVDAIAVGALTHSAPALDIGLDLVLERTGEGA